MTDPNLKLYYPFNGDLLDYSGNANHGVGHGTILYDTGRPGLGLALKLDGLTNYVTPTDSTPYNFDSGCPFSLACWYKNDKNINGRLFGKLFPSASGYVISITSGGTIQPVLRGTPASNQVFLNYPNNTRNGRWTHFAFSYDGSSKMAGCKLFIDGQNIGGPGGDTLTTSIASTNPLGIGAYGTGANFFEGMMQEVCIWNIAKTETDILAFYQAYVSKGVNPIITHTEFWK